MDSDSEPPKVTFFPPLHHQRRIWILDIIRRERLTQIVDIGCGEGSLLMTLCQPAPWLGAGHFHDVDAELSALFGEVGLNDQDTPDIHVRRIAGLDISSYELGIAAEETSPTSINPHYARWEPLDVELWQGSVDVINPAFINVECIVSTELIEHLNEDVLANVAPVVLGVYRPRLFLVTTPSYTFNGRWSAPGTRDPQGYLDPTGRTDRVFRHHDHKFEWTVEEFRQWCMGVAQRWGYKVEPITIGRPQEKDPWGRDKILGGATQVASFRRLDDRVSTEKRRRETQGFSGATNGSHTLVAKHYFEAHPRAGKPSDVWEIEEVIVQKFHQWRETNLKVRELWFADNMSELCGGSMEILINAVDHNPQLELQKIAGQKCIEWTVQLLGGLPPELPVENAAMEIESDVRMEDEVDYDVEDHSFDSGVQMGSNHEENPWCAEEIRWTLENGGEDNLTKAWNVGWGDDVPTEWERTEHIPWN